MLAMPTIREQCTASIASFLFSLGRAESNPGFPYQFGLSLLSGDSGIAWPVEYQRNILCKAFLRSDAEWLWFIDSDMMPKKNVMELLDMLPGSDIVAGIYPIPSEAGNPIVWSVYDYVPESRDKWCYDRSLSGGFVPMEFDFDHPEILEAGAAATGCMLIHRRVLEDPRMTLDDTVDPPTVFRTPSASNGECLATDDMDFCARLKNLTDYKIKVNTGVRWGHLKVGDATRTFDAMRQSYERGVDKSMHSGLRPDYLAGIQPVETV